MAEAPTELEGPDFEKGYETEKLPDGEMLVGNAFGEPVLVAKRGEELFTIGRRFASVSGPPGLWSRVEPRNKPGSQ